MSLPRRRPLSLTNLRAFEAVARRLNFSDAADELFLTQSANSRQIKSLEDEQPVVRGREETTTQILVYSLGLFLVTMAMYPVAHMGQIYLASAVTLGGIFVFKALRLRQSQSQADAWNLFKYSILYLALLFTAVAVDGLVR